MTRQVTLQPVFCLNLPESLTLLMRLVDCPCRLVPIVRTPHAPVEHDRAAVLHGSREAVPANLVRDGRAVQPHLVAELRARGPPQVHDTDQGASRLEGPRHRATPDRVGTHHVAYVLLSVAEPAELELHSLAFVVDSVVRGPPHVKEKFPCHGGTVWAPTHVAHGEWSGSAREERVVASTRSWGWLVADGWAGGCKAMAVFV